MNRYIDIFLNSFGDYFNYLKGEILDPGWTNYFYWLIGLSLLVMALEVILPWRKDQKILRKGFFLDVFYIFFNFFLFSLIGYNAISNVGVALFNDFLGLFDLENIVALQVDQLPAYVQLLIMFLIADFIQWLVHIQLHKNPVLWEFHKVHHSIKEMSFAAQFRFHFMETIIYKSVQYIPLAMIGFGIQEFFIVHMFAVLVGHLNHANLGWDYGILGRVFNNPKMHIWHHARELPDSHPYGMNFGLTLSIWDYLFGTAYVPKEGKDIDLGFDNIDEYPDNFWTQLKKPFQNLRSK